MGRTAETFAPLFIEGPVADARFWSVLADCWLDSPVERPLGVADRVSGGRLREELYETLWHRDRDAMPRLIDMAEDAGVNPELCDLTRRALRVQYPAE